MYQPTASAFVKAIRARPRMPQVAQPLDGQVGGVSVVLGGNAVAGSRGPGRHEEPDADDDDEDAEDDGEPVGDGGEHVFSICWRR